MTTSINPTSVISLPRVRKAQAAVNQLPLFWEDWHDQFLDAAKWVMTITSSGDVTFSQAPGVASLNQTCRPSTGSTSGGAIQLATRYPVFLPRHGQTANTTLIESTSFEFVMRGSDVTDLDNTKTFFGLADSQTALKTTNNLIGFYFSSDVLRVFVDDGGTETTAATTNVITTTNTIHTYRISLDRSNGVRYYVDDTLEATITTNVPNARGGLYIVYSFTNDNADTYAPWLMEQRVWAEDIL